MASNAAHLSRSLTNKPSLFEVLAQDSLHSTLSPALRTLAQYIKSLNPRRFWWLTKWFDEIYLLFDSILQYNYINHYAASFAESFYGLRRIPLKPQTFDHGHHLPKKQERLSLFFLIVFPYIRRKMDLLAEQFKLDEMDGVQEKGWKATLQSFYIKFHSIFHVFFETACLMQYLAYMSGKSECPSPLLRISSLTLKYAPSETETDEKTWTDFLSNITKCQFSEAKVTFGMVGTALLRGMELGAFFIQFLKWWDEKGVKPRDSILPIPDVPIFDVRSSQYSNICPICLQKWKIPTVLQVSGYVFCYKCIMRHLESDNNCPVTKYPANSNQLVRLYV